MKRFKSRIAICLMSVVAMVFALTLFARGEVQAAEAEAAQNKELGSYTVNKGDYTKKEYYVGELYLDQSVNELVFYGSNTIVLRDSNGNKVTYDKEWFYDEDIAKYITKAGVYKVYAENVSTSGIRDAEYIVTYTLKKDVTYTYTFDSLKATATESGMDAEPAVKLEYSKFDGPSTDQLAIFRVSNGKVRKLDTSYYSGLVDNIKIKYGTKYTYYIVDLSYVTGSAKTTLSGVGTKDETLTNSIKTALTDSHVTKSNTVTTKNVPIAPVTNLKVYERFVRKVELTWGRGVGYVDGYVLKSYNSAGKLMQTNTVDELGYAGSKIYIPYEGKSKVTVQPFYTYEGKKIYGKKVTIKGITSKKLTAPGGNVTKLSNTKASITTNRSADAKGIEIQQKKGSKWVAVAKSTSKTVKKNWTKNNAGKTTYRMRHYLVDRNKKTYYSAWKTFTPKANKKSYTKWSVDYFRDAHGSYSSYWCPSSISYSNGKVKVTGRFLNTWYLASTTCKVKVTFKVDGKVIGTKTVSAKVGANSAKSVTFYLNNSVKGKDLYRASYSVKYLSR